MATGYVYKYYVYGKDGNCDLGAVRSDVSAVMSGIYKSDEPGMMYGVKA